MCSYGLTPLESIGINSFVHYAAAKLLSSAVARTNAHAPDVDEAFFTGISSFGALCARLVTYEIGMKRQPKRCATRAGALAPRHG
ncbi:MAG: hypothetical protein EB059_04600 [Alphaproteobacteria bacterium]|nr:hypothetical protein [Alphaproteobacteria bacterium]